MDRKRLLKRSGGIVAGLLTGALACLPSIDGEQAMPAANAAYIQGGEVFRSPVSWGTMPGNDGNQWFPVQ